MYAGWPSQCSSRDTGGLKGGNYPELAALRGVVTEYPFVGTISGRSSDTVARVQWDLTGGYAFQPTDHR